MDKCWRCEQKAEWKKELYNIEKELAIKLSKENGRTTAIWKYNGRWQHGFIDTIPVGATAIEYISKHQ